MNSRRRRRRRRGEWGTFRCTACAGAAACDCSPLQVMGRRRRLRRRWLRQPFWPLLIHSQHHSYRWGGSTECSGRRRLRSQGISELVVGVCSGWRSNSAKVSGAASSSVSRHVVASSRSSEVSARRKGSDTSGSNGQLSGALQYRKLSARKRCAPERGSSDSRTICISVSDWSAVHAETSPASCADVRCIECRSSLVSRRQCSSSEQTSPLLMPW